MSFLGATGTLEVNTAGTLTITNALAVGANTVLLDGAGSTLTDLADLTLAGGTISGLGTLTANTDITGFGTVSIPLSSAGTLTASGGTLDLTGTVSNRTLAISSASPSDLKISGTATSAAAITLNNANQTLEIGAAGSLTINAAQAVTGGTIQMDGGTLTDSAGITLTSPATLTGSGTVAANTALSGTGTVTASGGTLDLLGTVNSGLVLAIAPGSPSILKIDGTATSAAAITLNNANQTLEIGAAASLTINAAQTATNGTIKIDGGTLTDFAGITLTSPAALTGSGTVAANTALSGTGTVTASGGTLDLLGTVNSGLVLAIATSSPSTLKIDGTATSAAAITLNNANQTLEIGASASLTINAAQTATNGTIKIDGGTLTAPAASR